MATTIGTKATRPNRRGRSSGGGTPGTAADGKTALSFRDATAYDSAGHSAPPNLSRYDSYLVNKFGDSMPSWLRDRLTRQYGSYFDKPAASDTTSGSTVATDPGIGPSTDPPGTEESTPPDDPTQPEERPRGQTLSAGPVDDPTAPEERPWRSAADRDIDANDDEDDAGPAASDSTSGSTVAADPGIGPSTDPPGNAESTPPDDPTQPEEPPRGYTQSAAPVDDPTAPEERPWRPEGDRDLGANDDEGNADEEQELTAAMDWWSKSHDVHNPGWTGKASTVIDDLRTDNQLASEIFGPAGESDAASFRFTTEKVHYNDGRSDADMRLQEETREATDIHRPGTLRALQGHLFVAEAQGTDPDIQVMRAYTNSLLDSKRLQSQASGTAPPDDLGISSLDVYDDIIKTDSGSSADAHRTVGILIQHGLIDDVGAPVDYDFDRKMTGQVVNRSQDTDGVVEIAGLVSGAWAGSLGLKLGGTIISRSGVIPALARFGISESVSAAPEVLYAASPWSDGGMNITRNELLGLGIGLTPVPVYQGVKSAYRGAQYAAGTNLPLEAVTYAHGTQRIDVGKLPRLTPDQIPAQKAIYLESRRQAGLPVDDERALVGISYIDQGYNVNLANDLARGAVSEAVTTGRPAVVTVLAPDGSTWDRATLHLQTPAYLQRQGGGAFSATPDVERYAVESAKPGGNVVPSGDGTMPVEEIRRFLSTQGLRRFMRGSAWSGTATPRLDAAGKPVKDAAGYDIYDPQEWNPGIAYDSASALHQEPKLYEVDLGSGRKTLTKEIETTQMPETPIGDPRIVANLGSVERGVLTVSPEDAMRIKREHPDWWANNWIPFPGGGGRPIAVRQKAQAKLITTDPSTPTGPVENVRTTGGYIRHRFGVAMDRFAAGPERADTVDLALQSPTETNRRYLQVRIDDEPMPSTSYEWNALGDAGPRDRTGGQLVDQAAQDARPTGASGEWSPPDDLGPGASPQTVYDSDFANELRLYGEADDLIDMARGVDARDLLSHRYADDLLERMPDRPVTGATRAGATRVPPGTPRSEVGRTTSLHQRSDPMRGGAETTRDEPTRIMAQQQRGDAPSPPADGPRSEPPLTPGDSPRNEPPETRTQPPRLSDGSGDKPGRVPPGPPDEEPPRLPPDGPGSEPERRTSIPMRTDPLRTPPGAPPPRLPGRIPPQPPRRDTPGDLPDDPEERPRRDIDHEDYEEGGDRYPRTASWIEVSRKTVDFDTAMTRSELLDDKHLETFQVSSYDDTPPVPAEYTVGNMELVVGRGKGVERQGIPRRVRQAKSRKLPKVYVRY